MDLNLSTPALLFPALSLLVLAYTNRYLHLAQLIRKLHADYHVQPDPLIIAQIGNLRHRIQLIKWMQFLGVSSILVCTLAILGLLEAWATASKLLFTMGLLLMSASLVVSLREIQLSGEALKLQLSDLEDEAARPRHR